MPLAHIRQIPGMHGIVSAIYDVAVGEIWPIDKIVALKAEIESHGLAFHVIESVPVHEDIKLGRAPIAARGWISRLWRAGPAAAAHISTHCRPPALLHRAKRRLGWRQGRSRPRQGSA